MRKLLLAAGAVAALAAGSAQATVIADAVGDFLPTYTGDHRADLDVQYFGASYDPATQRFLVDIDLVGAVDQTLTDSFYVIGVNTGTGPIAPFAGVGQPEVRFNQAIVVRRNGAAFLGANNFGAATITGDKIRLFVAASLLPSTAPGFRPDQYGFNVWPRLTATALSSLADFSPENSLISAAPEPATWGMMIAGFGLAGTMIRRRRLAATQV